MAMIGRHSRTSETIFREPLSPPPLSVRISCQRSDKGNSIVFRSRPEENWCRKYEKIAISSVNYVTMSRREREKEGKKERRNENGQGKARQRATAAGSQCKGQGARGAAAAATIFIVIF